MYIQTDMATINIGIQLILQLLCMPRVMRMVPGAGQMGYHSYLMAVNLAIWC